MKYANIDNGIQLTCTILQHFIFVTYFFYRPSPTFTLLHIFKKYYSRLVKSLPMDDPVFLAELYSNDLLPGDTKAFIESQSTKAQKSSKFLDIIIKPTVERDDGTRFCVLVEVMKNYEDDNVWRLADEILSTIRQGSVRRKTIASMSTLL